MSIIFCSIKDGFLDTGTRYVRRTWRLFGLPLFSTVQVVG